MRRCAADAGLKRLRVLVITTKILPPKPKLQIKIMSIQNHIPDASKKVGSNDLLAQIKKLPKTEFHCSSSCNKCGGLNEVKVTDTVAGRMCEAETVCVECQHKDLWSYGFFESMARGLNECRKYTS